ncbi:DUF2326 domain-containing protein [Vibrio vulnificus]|nr:DUF2326 domain-containing protein [Vibrio vulnificus]
MLKSICCDKLVKPVLNFSSGLNCLIGSTSGSNSIGKSSVLMIIDFCFGGDDLIKSNKDIFENVGHLDIEFSFEFQNTLYKFKRSTANPGVVIFENDLDNPSTIAKFRAFLKHKYDIPDSLSFRDVVNLTSRIWGKGNFNPNRPLNFDDTKYYDQATKYLMVLFNLYGEVSQKRKEHAELESKKSALKSAFDQEIISKKLKKSELPAKKKELEHLESKKEELKFNLSKYTTNINEIVNHRSLLIKKEKDSVLESLKFEEQRLFRTEKSLEFGTFANKKQFGKLVDYFPNVNLEKLKYIESFHSGVSKLLKNEIYSEKLSIEQNIIEYKNEINELDKKLNEVIKLKENPTLLIDDLLSLAIKTKELQQQIDFRELSDNIDNSTKQAKEESEEIKKDKLKEVANILNSAINPIISTIYDKPALPYFEFENKDYKFNPNGDTGTGKCYSNMISLDLVLLENTILPFFIHDSVVLKNIEVSAVSNIISLYKKFESSNKQVFISIDELPKYPEQARAILMETEFLTLSEQDLAFKQKWERH